MPTPVPLRLLLLHSAGLHDRPTRQRCAGPVCYRPGSRRLLALLWIARALARRGDNPLGGCFSSKFSEISLAARSAGCRAGCPSNLGTLMHACRLSFVRGSWRGNARTPGPIPVKEKTCVLTQLDCRHAFLLRLKRDQTHAREIVSAPQSTAASSAGIQATFICGGFFG